MIASPAVRRVVQMRIGLVLAANGGALERMLPIFKMGFGGRIGDGKQYVSWISLPDLVGAMIHLLNSDLLSGAVNLVAAPPVTNHEFAETLGEVLNRPALVPVPTIAVKGMFGEMGEELLLSSAKVSNNLLVGSGYEFQHTSLESALKGVLSL